MKLYSNRYLRPQPSFLSTSWAEQCCGWDNGNIFWNRLWPVAWSLSSWLAQWLRLQHCTQPCKPCIHKVSSSWQPLTLSTKNIRTRPRESWEQSCPHRGQGCGDAESWAHSHPSPVEVADDQLSLSCISCGFWQIGSMIRIGSDKTSSGVWKVDASKFLTKFFLL